MITVIELSFSVFYPCILTGSTNVILIIKSKDEYKIVRYTDGWMDEINKIKKR